MFLLTGVFQVNAQQEKQTFKLGDSSLIITKPKEIIFADFIFTWHPSLNFLLPPGEHGGIPSKPSFTIEAFEFDEKPEIKTINDIKKTIKNNPNYEARALFSFNKIKSGEIAEITGIEEFEVHVDFVVGGAEDYVEKNKYYKLIIEHDGKLYSCSMEDNVDEFDKYFSIAKELCHSIKFEN
jgi:hypothetical protein